MAVFQFLPADSLEIYLHAHRPFAYGEIERKWSNRSAAAFFVTAPEKKGIVEDPAVHADRAIDVRIQDR